MGLGAEICFRWSRRKVLTRRQGQAGENAATFDSSAYEAWRRQELERQFVRHFQGASLEGLDVLDFGCGSGALSFLAARDGARSVLGVEIDAESAAAAKRRAAEMGSVPPPRFLVLDDPRRLPVDDASFDRVLCFDVLEHVMDPAAALGEWWRVLRPGGRVLIWWVPWWHPYGPHIESLVPIPWCHVLFSEKTLLETCARIYEMPEFQPRIWDRDASGDKRPNKWRKLDALPGVNKLSMRRFEGLVQGMGWRVPRRERHGFSSGVVAPLTRVFTRIPFIREFVTSCVVYELEKPPEEGGVSGSSASSGSAQ